MNEQIYGCIVIGGGHAGAEAAYASAKMGVRTLLITMSKEAIAKMSCNPAIGGLAKGQIVREIDALGGLMGLAIDATGIQFRMLNSSKGPAVRSPRAQADKYKYKDWVCEFLEQTENLDIEENEATSISAIDGKVEAVRCKDGKEFKGQTVVVTTGTFLKGIMHLGDEKWEGGRLDEPASNELSDSLMELGFELGRLKTGTPVRIAGDSIDIEKCQVQDGDEDRRPFSFMNDGLDRPQLPCWITYTNEKIHELLKANFDRAPLYTGQIESTGPRYCPSIETKIIRFADKNRHMVYLEPEDEAVSTIYCNGISTSVPRDVQEEMLRLMEGTENSRIVHYAYAIEYDYAPAKQLWPSLETRRIEGLYFAGQINGTSGYEEAGGQGLVAGVNAARKVQGKEPLILGRDQAYIGVLIDDLLTKDIDEPYRMFTSRAEYRLTLRSDNADRRLTPIGREIGLVDDARWNRFEKKMGDIDELKKYLQKTRRQGVTLWQLLKQPESELAKAPCDDAEISGLGYKPEVVEAAAIESLYEGYLKRQVKEIERMKNLDKIKLPDDLDYDDVSHLSNEARGKLKEFRPVNLGQVSRIGGISPADITVIQVYLRRKTGQIL